MTQLLAEAGKDGAASAKLFEAVYADLKAIAAGQMRGERADHTLQATALVSEAYVRLIGTASIEFEDRRHFFRVASEAMRRILIDHARARLAEKRGGGARGRALLEDDGAVTMEPERLIELDDALAKFALEDERAAELVRLRFFGGLTLEQAAEMAGVSRRTAIRDWSFARARLAELMGGEG
ncbi:MAG: ECF-type sigma factor [Phycisphaerales bacterium]